MTTDSRPPFVLHVALPVPLRRSFEYLPPGGANLAAAARATWIGCRVLVPFGRGKQVGVVIGHGHATLLGSNLKRVLQRLDEIPVLREELLETLIFAARYYMAPIGEMLDTALPARLREARALPPTPVLAYRLRLGAGVHTGASPSAPASVLERIPASTRKPTRGSTQLGLLELLQAGAQSASEILARFPTARPSLKKLIEAGQVEALTRLPARFAKPVISAPPHHEAQRAAIDGIHAQAEQFAVHLLDGVTGSGKTEVYIELAAKTIASGRQVLILVPEIGLTPQTMTRFRERLPGTLVAFHSGLADGERADAWLAMQRGDADVAVGTRSAVFTPMPRGGLIVVDEEHDGSYKQLDGVRYSARDLAIKRAQSMGIPIVLGSATPALETLQQVTLGRYQRWRLPVRAGFAKPPQIDVVDVRQQRLQQGLSPVLIGLIRTTLDRGEQALVFRNRRGYAPALLCHACGWHADCNRCDRPMTWHRQANELRCHHCARIADVPRVCPECGSSELAPSGVGTERLEEVLRELFPQTKIVRIDRDTTRTRDALENQLDGVRNDQAAILIGTQMLAKGHDLPNLTLCGIINIDNGLFGSDFRSEERLAQLIVQVAGRVGRAAKPGRVALQTHQPDHPLIVRLLQQGYSGFAAQHLQERQLLGLPPFTHLAILRAEAQQQSHIDEFFAAVLAARQTLLDARPTDSAATNEASPSQKSMAKSSTNAVQVLGPLPAAMPRRAGFLRSMIWLQSASRKALHAELEPLVLAIEALKQARKVRWSMDVDPSESG